MRIRIQAEEECSFQEAAATSLPHMRPLTWGTRISSYFWIRSMIPDEGQRTLLFDRDLAIQRIAGEAPEHPSAVQVGGATG